MIPNFAIKRFLEQPRSDFHKWKKVAPTRLEALKKELLGRPPIWSRLRIHQKICFLIGVHTRKFAFFNDTGTGKSMLAIALARYFASIGEVRKVLVLVPARVNKDEWAREILKNAPQTEFLVLRGSSKEKWEQLQENESSLLVIETYAGLTRMVCQLTEINKRGKKKSKLKPDPRLTEQLIELFDGLVTDEGTVLGNHRSLPYRICRRMLKSVKIYFNLTGTPFGRDPTLLWSQMYLVDRGETLGATLGLYRAAFFKQSINYWGGIDYTFDKKKQDILSRMLAHRSIRYEAEDSDLPTVIRIHKQISLTHDANTYADRARQALLQAKGNYREMKNAFLRMRQISSGFVGYHDDEKSEKAEFEFDENPKLEMLISLLQSIEHKTIVFNEFHYSGARICAELKRVEIGHVHVNGLTKDPGKMLHLFDHDPKVQVLVLSNAMVMGLNLQIAKYGIFYESPVSVIMRKQAERRIERQGSQHNKVFIYDLITRNTYDLRILEFHREGKDLFKAIVQGLEKP